MSFDFSSTTSSDDGSVIDISDLLPDNTNNTKGASSLLFDSPSKVDQKEDSTAKHESDGAGYNKIPELKEKASAKQPSEDSSKEDVPKEGSQDTIRIIMGESVKNWQRQRQRQRQNNPRRTSISTATRNAIHEKKISPENANQPSYIVVQQRDASSDSKTAEKAASVPIDFKKSHVEVHSTVGGSRVDIVEALSTSDEKQRRHTAKTVKRQLSQHGNQAPPTSSAFVDCIAIWDAERQAYTLEIPELIASDIRLAQSSIDRDNALEPNRGQRKQNPLQEQKQAEAQLLQSRKRRRL